MSGDRTTNVFLIGPFQISNYNHFHRGSQDDVHEQLRTSTSCLKILAFIMPVIVNLIQLMYQKNDNSPFQTHPTTILVGVFSLLVCAFAYGVEMTFTRGLSPTCTCIVLGLVKLFGSLSLASLTSLLFPNWVRPIVYFIYVVLPLAEFRMLLARWIHRCGVVKLTSLLQACLRLFHSCQWHGPTRMMASWMLLMGRLMDTPNRLPV